MSDADRTTDADRTIDALRAGHDGLADLVPALSAEALAAPSGAAEWDLAQVLSHLGSGAEITQATLRAALHGEPHPGGDANRLVWDRWDAMTREEQAEGFLAANQELTELFESLDADTRETLRIDMGFLPAPIDVATAAGLRLNELALHSWDVRVGLDPGAALEPRAAAVLLPGPSMLIAWISKPEQLHGSSATLQVTTTEPASSFVLRLGDPVSLGTDIVDAPDGTLTIPAEAWLRLLTGRLDPAHTPSDVQVGGAADLDQLRLVFPGF